MMVTIEGSSFSSGIGPQSPISFSLLPLPACAVATGPAAHDRSPSFPCTGRHCTGKTKGKEAGQPRHHAPGKNCWNWMPSRHWRSLPASMRAWGLLSLWGQAGGSPHAASTPTGRTGQTEQGTSRSPSIGTRKKACCS